MSKQTKPKTVNLKIRVSPRQHAALTRESKRRGITAACLLREQIGVVTGVQDPLKRTARQGDRKRHKRHKKTTA